MIFIQNDYVPIDYYYSLYNSEIASSCKKFHFQKTENFQHLKVKGWLFFDALLNKLKLPNKIPWSMCSFSCAYILGH